MAMYRARTDFVVGTDNGPVVIHGGTVYDSADKTYTPIIKRFPDSFDEVK